MKWYRFDPVAFNEGVASLTLEEVGAYILVINAYYARDGHLPDDDYLLSRIVRVNPRTWRKYKFALFQKQKLHVDTTGGLVPNRGISTLNEARTFSELQRNRIGKRWNIQQNQRMGNTRAVLPIQPHSKKERGWPTKRWEPSGYTNGRSLGNGKAGSITETKLLNGGEK